MEHASFEVNSSSPDTTMEIGTILSTFLSAGDILGFSGELGSGKTMMIRGICLGLDVKEKVTSSSFVLMRPLTGRFPVYHFDLYRLNSKEEIEDLGCDEYLYSDGISLLEWSDRLELFKDPHYIGILLRYETNHEEMRTITFKSENTRFYSVLHKLQESLAMAGFKTIWLHQ